MSYLPQDSTSEAILDTYRLEGDKIVEPKSRLRSAAQLRNIHKNLKDDDEPSEKNRAKIQSMMDKEPPLNSSELKKRGRSYQFNLNFGEGLGIKNDALNSYLDIYTSPEFLLDIKLDRRVTDVSSAQDKEVMERILSDEYTKMFRNWSASRFNFIQLVDQFLTHGVSVGYFRDSSTWQFSPAGLSDFKFPRRTKASADSVEVCTCEVDLGPAELAGYIQDEDVATSAGWNVDLCKMVIAKHYNNNTYDHESYEDLQEKVKANDLNECTTYNSISVIQCWVKEHDGSVSYYIAPLTNVCEEREEDSEKYNKEFLYKESNAYPSMDEAIFLFPFYTGNRGNIYTIRGLGYLVYDLVQASNLIQSAALDSARSSMSLKFISTGEKHMDKIPITHAGPYTLINPALQIAPNQVEPDLSRSSVPAINLLQGQISKMSASSSMSDVFNNAADRRSKFEVSSAIEYFSAINSAAQRLFYMPWRSMLVNSAKRAFSELQNDSTSAGTMATNMRNRCIARGFNPDFFDLIDWEETHAKVPIGLGSKAARNAAYEQGASLLPYMDQPGREAFARDRAIDYFGLDNARRYISFEDDQRQPIDVQIASLENFQIMSGADLQPSPSENFFSHLEVHTRKLVELAEALESGEADLREVTPRMAALWQHAQATLQYASTEEIVEPQLAQYKQTLQQVGEIVQNGLRQLEADARKAQEEQAAAAQEGVQGTPDEKTLEYQFKQAKFQQELAQRDASHQQKLIQNEQDHMQKLQQAAQEAAVKARPQVRPRP